MPTTDGRHERDGEVPRWAATAGQPRFRAPRWASRLFCTHRRTTDDSDPEVPTPGVPWSVRDRVLREYHAVNLAQARRASEELVRAGFNTGAVPYGYRAQRIRVAPARRKPRWRTRLMIEPMEAATVKMIFTWCGEDGLTIAAIRQRLIAARYPAPLDPETGQPGVWTRAAIRAILRNPEVYRPPGLGPPSPRTTSSRNAMGLVEGVGASATGHRRRVRRGQSPLVVRGNPARPDGDITTGVR